MAYYKDLREHINALEKNNKLIRIKREINKDTELMPLVRWQYRGLGEKDRKAFLFENVVDAKGKRYDIPVLVGAHGASREVYALGMKCTQNEIMERWIQAQLHPIAPRMVDNGPVHEEVYLGDRLLQRGGLDELPVPISTPGFDNAPYLSAGCWVTKDPETGKRNIGTYRGMIKSNVRIGNGSAGPTHLNIHWGKCKQRGKPLQAAIVIGGSPAIGFLSVARVPYETDEYTVAGGIAGEPIELVKCKTVDIEVPAAAEIVIEGEMPIDSLERDGPFGEYSGYMGKPMEGTYFNATCITHRRKPIFDAFLGQFTPSEGSVVSSIGREVTLHKFLRYDCSLPVLDVAIHGNGAHPYLVIKMKKARAAQSWQVLNGVVTLSPNHKFIIVVDEDIDPRDAESVNWAIAYRVEPERDTRIVHGISSSLDPSLAPPDEPEERYPKPNGVSALLIDATRKWEYPPVSLPARQFMERAKHIWEEEGLPELSPREPWYGYSLGYWTKEEEEEAELALKGEHYQTGEKIARNRTTL